MGRCEVRFKANPLLSKEVVHSVRHGNKKARKLQRLSRLQISPAANYRGEGAVGSASLGLGRPAARIGVGDAAA